MGRLLRPVDRRGRLVRAKTVAPPRLATPSPPLPPARVTGGRVVAGHDAAAGDADLDLALVQVAAAARVIVALIGVQLVEPPTGAIGPRL